jgi:peptidoglycan DL-endopeptidase CwlO
MGALGAVLLGVGLPRASADQISDLKAQAAALGSRIQALGQEEEALSERYDQAQLNVQTLEAKVAQATRQLNSAEASTAQARSVLRQDAINAYVNGGTDSVPTGAGTMQNANNGLLRAEYVDTLATNETEAIDQFHTASLQEKAAQNNLKQQTSAAQAQERQVQQAQEAVSNTQTQLQAALQQDTGRIAVLVRQQQEAAAAAAARAAQQRLAAAAAQQAAAQQAAAQQAATQQNNSTTAGPPDPSSPSGSPPVNYNPPPVGSGAAGAVAAAESRVGDWYQWGAAGPNTFDCSGLVMWAYEQVGISLPHFSGAQYADTTHIPMSDLQPGDLVFPADPSQHVAMYVGGGDIIEAPYTGAQVHIVPMGSWFVLASRVE